MADMLTRRCPECGAKVASREDVFASPRKCPKCGAVVLFADSLEGPKVKLHAVDTFLNKNVAAFNIAAILLLLTTLACILFAGAGVAVICSLIFFAAGIVCAYLYLNQRAAVASLKERKDKFEELLAKYKGLKRNFDGHLKDEKLRLASTVADKISAAERREGDAMMRMGAVDTLATRFLDDTLKWSKSRLTPNNFVASKERLLKVIKFCREAGQPIEGRHVKELVSELKQEFEMVLRRDFEKKEQARIKQQIREEQKAQREFEREMAKIDGQKKALESALKEAMARVKDEHSAEIEELRERLKEAEERGQRAKSMAQMTKAGHVYVISNVGSFGDNVFKIGLTRRLEPMQRVKELGDASVPFPFDVHMMIHSDNAPALESALHNEFDRLRLNKVNMRKEFFRIDFQSIHRAVERHHGEVSFLADAEALEYRQSVDMTDEDFEFVSEAVKEIEGDGDIFDE